LLQIWRVNGQELLWKNGPCISRGARRDSKQTRYCGETTITRLSTQHRRYLCLASPRSSCGETTNPSLDSALSIVVISASPRSSCGDVEKNPSPLQSLLHPERHFIRGSGEAQRTARVAYPLEHYNRVAPISKELGGVS